MIGETICRECNKKCILCLNSYMGEIEVSGNKCIKGIDYGKKYIINKKGIFTTIVRIKGSDCTVVPVKSSDIIEKEKWVAISRALCRIYVGAPIKAGDVICKNILNTGVDIICSKTVNKKVDALK